MKNNNTNENEITGKRAAFSINDYLIPDQYRDLMIEMFRLPDSILSYDLKAGEPVLLVPCDEPLNGVPMLFSHHGAEFCGVIKTMPDLPGVFGLEIGGDGFLSEVYILSEVTLTGKIVGVYRPDSSGSNLFVKI